MTDSYAIHQLENCVWYTDYRVCQSVLDIPNERILYYQKVCGFQNKYIHFIENIFKINKKEKVIFIVKKVCLNGTFLKILVQNNCFLKKFLYNYDR